MLEVRSTVHLAVRLAVRVNIALQQSARSPEQPWLWLAAVPFFVALDIAVWLRLGRDDDFGLTWRLPLDTLDAAFWVASPLPASGHYDWAILIAIPLGIEAGVRLGRRAFIVPAAILTTTSLSAMLTGKSVRLLGTWWISLAVAMGIAFFRYCRHLDGRAEVERQRARAAARRRAYLAGQNQVAMGASSAVDVIEGLVPVLGGPEPGSALWQLADGWKTDLSAATAQEAKYLKVALMEWEQAHNRHPDLSALVRVSLDQDEGTTILTATQARQLGVALDRLDSRGALVVRLHDPDPARLPGQALRLKVNGQDLSVPADRRAAPPSLDPCAVTYLYMVVLTLAGMLPDMGGVPLGPAAVGVATCAVIGIVSHRRIVTSGERARLGAFALALVAATVLTLVYAFARTPVTADGEPMFGSGSGMLLLSFLGGFYWRSLPGWRWLMPVVMGANVVLCVRLFPTPSAITIPDVAASLIYSLVPYFPCRHLAGALERARARHAVLLHTRDDGDEQLAFHEGQESVAGLVLQARGDALRQLERLQPHLEAGVAQMAFDRLEEVERRLRATGSVPGSSSSTTTA
jgi:hypothetical protein